MVNRGMFFVIKFGSECISFIRKLQLGNVTSYCESLLNHTFLQKLWSVFYNIIHAKIYKKAKNWLCI